MDEATESKSDSTDSPKSIFFRVAADAPNARLLLAQVVDLLPIAVAIVADDLQIRALNQAAKVLADARNGLTVLADRLVCLSGRSQLLLERTLRRLREAGAGRRRAALRVTRRSGCDLQLLIAESTPDVQDGAESLWCIWVFDMDVRSSIDPARLRELHGLTDAEAAVTASLFLTGSLDSTAAELKVSIHTVKTHLRHIFVKCGIRSQVELVRMLALGPR